MNVIRTSSIHLPFCEPTYQRSIFIFHPTSILILQVRTFKDISVPCIVSWSNSHHECYIVIVSEVSPCVCLCQETSFADTGLVPRSLVKIAWLVPKEIPGSSCTSLLVSLQLAVTKSCTVAIVPAGKSVSVTLEAFCGYVPMFKAEEPLQKLCMAPCLLSKGNFNHSSSFFACFHYLCTKVSYSQTLCVCCTIGTLLFICDNCID